MSIAFVQGDSSNDQTTTTGTLVFPSNVTSGSFIYVAIDLSAVSTTCTISDTIGNTYNEIEHVDASTHSIWHFYAENTSTGSNTLTITAGTSCNIRSTCAEYSGVNTSSPIDVFANNGGSSDTSLTVALTTNYDNDAILGAFRWSSAQTPTAGANYTIRESTPASPFIALLDFITGDAAGAETLSATLGTAAAWQGVAVAVRQQADVTLIPKRSFRIYEYTYEA